MRKILEFIKMFFYITTSVLLMTAVSVTLSGEEMVYSDVLWDILLAGFLTAIVTVIFGPAGDEKPVLMWAKMGVHYVALCVVMCILGGMFGWMPLGVKGVVVMCADVALVYAIVFVACIILDKRQADAINKKLKEKYGEEE